FTDVKISPDGRAIVIGTLRADWDQSIFRKDLWLYRDDANGNGTLTQLTQSGHDAQPQWSPDGRWIAFLSERKTEKTEADSTAKSKVTDDSKNESDATPGSHVVASTPWRAEQIVTSPDGSKLAFLTTSVSERQEKVSEFEIYAVDLTTAAPDRPPHQVTHNEAVENNLHWPSDNRHVF